jgi:plasmid stabilization system protein ParE
MRVRWTPLARIQALEIAETISWDKPGAAARWLERLFTEAESLAEMSRRGRVVPELDRADTREILMGNYRVIYGVRNDEIAILTVRHGRRLLDFDEFR